MARPTRRSSFATARSSRSSSTPIKHADDDKENFESVTTPPQSATPYWKALEIDEREASPRETRSAKKKQKPPGILMSFSPPDQKANAEREKKDLEQKERERALKISKARESGQMMVFSPVPTSRRKPRRTNSDLDQKLAFTMDLSPDPKAPPPPPSQLIVAKDKLANAECKLQEAQMGLLQAQKRCDDLERQLQDSLQLKEHNHAQLTEQLLHKEAETAELSNNLDDLKFKYAELSRHLEELRDAHEQDKHEISLKEQTVRELSSVLQTVSEREQSLEIKLAQVAEEYLNRPQPRDQLYSDEEFVAMQVAKTSAEALTKEFEAKFEETKRIIQNVSEREQSLEIKLAQVTEEYLNRPQPRDQLHSDDDFEAMRVAKTSAEALTKELEAKFEETKRILQKASEREQSLETKLAQVAEEYLDRPQPRDQLHSDDDFEAMLVAKTSAESLTKEFEAKFEETKKHLASKEREICKSKEHFEKERGKFELQRSDLEQQVTTLISNHGAIQQDKVHLEQMVSRMEKELEGINQKTKKSDIEYCSLLVSFKALQKHNEQLVLTNNSLQTTLNSANQKTDETAIRAEHIGKQLSSAQSLIKSLQGELQIAAKNLQLVMLERKRDGERLATFDAREEVLLCKLAIMDDIRRNLHNKVLTLSGNIQVFVRVRPTIDQEREEAASTSASGSRGIKRKQLSQPDAGGDFPFSFPDLFEHGTASSSSNCDTQSCDDITKQVIVAVEPYKDRGGLKNRQKKWKFGFDHVFSPNQSQQDVWVATEPLVQSAIDGFNVCVFAYGQTGSGKTYTMIGGNNNERGIIFHSVEKLFQAKRELEASSGSVSVELSVELLEIYNESVFDLLSPKKRQEIFQDNSLRIVSNDAFGNVRATVESEQDVSEILSLASSKRCVKATNSNAESSRSHMLFTIHFVAKKEGKIMRVGKLHICDLAGSERLDKSGCHMMADGSLLKETQNINTSLMCLSNVIEKLQAKDRHIPYRDSKLTMLLQNSLGGDSKTLAIVCCNPLAEHFNESMSSIRFASKVSRVELKSMAKVTM